MPRRAWARLTMTTPTPAMTAQEGNETMGKRNCISCGKEIRDGDQLEHLRTDHLGPHYFWMGAREYRTDEPSMTGVEIRKLTNSSTHGMITEDRDGQWIYYSDGQAIDLTHRPHLFVLLPATT